MPAQRTGPESISQQSPQNPLAKATGSGTTLADSHSQRELQPQGAESVERGRAGDSGEEMADTDSRGGEVPLEGQQSGEQMSGSSGKEGRTGVLGWTTEPLLGRVVDGCPDRVDRIRLLGNGVVPQTAAKAWITLTPPTQGDAS
ncbi:hypothetical protein N9J84_05280 [Porticoccaceae bacterium]|nr:hypothetical protein [Porticoccaceae bacterium]